MGKTAKQDEYKEGECEYCGYSGTVFTDNSRCQDCDGDFVTCSICKEEQHVDSRCRHVFRAADYEWTGAGAYTPSQNVKISFLALLTAMPLTFGADLKIAIQSGRFHTWRVSPLIGGGGSLTLYGMPNRDGQMMILKWGDDLLSIGEADESEKLSDGFSWLVSLYNRDTRKANRLTIAWINDWKNMQATP